MLKEVANTLRRSLAPRLVRVGLGAHEAEDLVQEILIGLHGKRHTWDPARPFLPWLHTITRYKLIDFMRHRRGDTRRRVDLPLEDWVEIVESPACEADRSTWEVDRHLAVLPVSQRKIVRAIAVEGASVRNVALRFATSEGAVRVIIHRAIRRLLGDPAEPTR
jgi:RNA polymerase sigma-70 factor (ECF subfamily)